MPRGLDDAVRTYQLPTSAPSQPFVSQANLAANTPIFITPGFGNGGAAPKPPLATGGAHYDTTVTSYMDQAAVEMARSGGIGIPPGP